MTSKGVPFEGPFSPTIDASDIRINHYWTRDEDYLRNQKIPRGITWGQDVEKILDRARLLNGFSDQEILRFVPKLKSLTVPWK